MCAIMSTARQEDKAPDIPHPLPSLPPNLIAQTQATQVTPEQNPDHLRPSATSKMSESSEGPASPVQSTTELGQTDQTPSTDGVRIKIEPESRRLFDQTVAFEDQKQAEMALEDASHVKDEHQLETLTTSTKNIRHRSVVCLTPDTAMDQKATPSPASSQQPVADDSCIVIKEENLEPESDTDEDDQSDSEYSDNGGEDCSDDDYEEVSDDEPLDTPENDDTGVKQPTPPSMPTDLPAPKKRRNPAKNAREYCARLYDRTSGRRAQRRGMLRNQGQQTGATGLLTPQQDGASLQDSAMPELQINTLAEYFTALRSHIPAGHDTRSRATQVKDLREAQRLYGNKHVRIAKGGKAFEVKSMKLPLMPHQLCASAWMLKQECLAVELSGGILADEMGMGKTVETLTCVSENPPDADDVKNFCWATLVLVPNCDIAVQWRGEIEKHCKPPISKKVMIYKASDRTSLRRVRNASVVHFKALREEHENDELAISEAMQRKAKRIGIIRWYRVVLDEGHAIKNRRSISECNSNLHNERLTLLLAANVCAYLQSKYRWALTGTPLANNTEEFHPYLKFLDCFFCEDFKEFKKKYLKDDQGRMDFEALISSVVYRRTKEDSFLEEKIVKLPECKDTVIKVPLSKEEAVFVAVLEALQKDEIENPEDSQETTTSKNRSKPAKSKQAEKTKKTPASTLPAKSKRGRPRKNKDTKSAASKNDDKSANPEEHAPGEGAPSGKKYAMMMWARQAVSHCFNLERMFRESLDLETTKKICDDLDKLAGMDDRQSVLDHILEKGSNTQQLAPYQEGFKILKELSQHHQVFGGCFHMEAVLDLLVEEHGARDVSCGLCGNSPPRRPTHSKKEETAPKKMKRFKNARRKTQPEITCKEAGCGCKLSVGSRVKTLKCIADEVVDKQSSKRFEEPGVDSNGVFLKRKAHDQTLFLAATTSQDDDLPPSTKLTITMAIILTWLKEHPDDKILVYTQFVMTGKILGTMLQWAGQHFVHYFGTGTIQKRERAKALARFKNDPNVKVMVMSLVSGGQSLNLTHANRVIMIDPWWNEGLEEQARGRVCRIGQEKTCHFVKILCDETIDDRVRQLQSIKAVEIAFALQDDGHIPSQVDDERLREMFRPRKKRKITHAARRSNDEDMGGG
ncbi:ATP-dependent helicase [Paramyrothecium foliicola]|nr:ATP-dependent helicase [Paramyrothecium foliicola]